MFIVSYKGWGLIKAVELHWQKLGTSILKKLKQELLRKQFNSSETGIFPKEKSKLHILLY